MNSSGFILLLWVFPLSLSFDVQTELSKYCRDKERLITSDELDEYLLVDAELESTLGLECHFCNEASDSQPRVWYFQDRLEGEEEKEVDLGMANNMSSNKIHLTPELNLIIKDFNLNDAGIYRCHGGLGQDVENKFNYRVEPISKDVLDIGTAKGNISDWEKYREVNLRPVTLRLAVSKMKPLAEIRAAGVSLEIVSEWSVWSPCQKCKGKKGIKTSKGQCRIKRSLENRTMVTEDADHIVKFFSKSPLLPCKSLILEAEFPAISSATKHLPEFILEEKCKKCPREKKAKKNKFKYKKRYTLADGAHLALVCPESTLESQIVWRKDSIVLKKGTGRSFRKKDKEARVMVDTFSTLYLIGVSSHEEGNYTCYVDDVRMMQVKIRVVSKSRLLTQAFFRHMGYLGFIFLLTSFCYCGGLIIACRKKNRFTTKVSIDEAED
ncbi:uncharacterized protein LOC135167304 [Diachasmimorpha longicaudata]|uniref:uncharacterized protein LOC135167304 n=1 Tax=Diachasmimorpha longicaudata TaxID=58733 RepID=UPI0030B8DDFB